MMKVGDREYCLAQRLVGKLGERQNLQKIAASTLRSALATIADLERELEEAQQRIEVLVGALQDIHWATADNENQTPNLDSIRTMSGAALRAAVEEG